MGYCDVRVSAPFDTRIGPFARSAQASLLLGRSLRNLYDPAPDYHLNMQEYYSLLSALNALSDIIPQEKFETCFLYCGSMGMVASALLLLTTANPYRSEFDSLTPAVIASNNAENASRLAITVAQDVLNKGDSINISSLCPLVPDSFSKAAFTQLALFQETHDEKHWKNLTTLEETLGHFSRRWTSAGTCSSIRCRGKAC